MIQMYINTKKQISLSLSVYKMHVYYHMYLRIIRREIKARAEVRPGTVIPNIPISVGPLVPRLCSQRTVDSHQFRYKRGRTPGGNFRC